MALMAWATHPHDGFTQINYRFHKKRWTAIFNTEGELVFLWCPFEKSKSESLYEFAKEEALDAYQVVLEERAKRKTN